MGKEKFVYGFDATVQQRNTINRQINRLRRRGYVIKDEVRALITSPVDTAGQLYKLISFKPEYGKTPEGQSKRVRWEISGAEGHELEKTLQKINRKRRQQAKAEGKEYKPLIATGVLPAVTTPRYPDKVALTEEVRRRLGTLKVKAALSIQEWRAKTLTHDKETFFQSVKQLFTALDPIRSWESMNLIKSFIDTLSLADWKDLIDSLPHDAHDVWTYYVASMPMGAVAETVQALAEAAKAADSSGWKTEAVASEERAIEATRQLWTMETTL